MEFLTLNSLKITSRLNKKYDWKYFKQCCPIHNNMDDVKKDTQEEKKHEFGNVIEKKEIKGKKTTEIK